MKGKGKRTDGWPPQHDRWLAPGTGHFSWCPTVGKALPRHCLLDPRTRTAFVERSRLPLAAGDFTLMFKSNDGLFGMEF